MKIIVCDLDILPTTRNCLNSPNNENFLNNDDGDFLPTSDDDTTYAPPKKICCRSSSSTSSSSSSSSSSNLSSSSSGKSSESSSTTSASHLSKCLQTTTQHTNLEDSYDIMGVLINTIDDFSDAPISSLDSYLNNQISETNNSNIGMLADIPQDIIVKPKKKKRKQRVSYIAKTLRDWKIICFELKYKKGLSCKTPKENL